MTLKQQKKSYHDQSIEVVLENFKVEKAKGLDQKEAVRLLEIYGLNTQKTVPPPSSWNILVNQFKSLVILVLVVAGTAAFVFGQWPEGIAILAVLVVNTVIGFVTELKAADSMHSLRAVAGEKARVRRNGEEFEIDSDHLVPGDIVILDAGDKLPADIRLIESNQIQAREAELTGESVPVSKQSEKVEKNAPLAERKSMVYKGTTLVNGSGVGVVVATGNNTEMGRIADLTGRAKKESTPLQRNLDRLGQKLAWISIFLAVVIGGVGLMAGQTPLHMIETSIALGLAAIPEGMPVIMTIALARGMYLMSLHNVLINKLPSVETLGATQVIFTDKTGTLTENRMTLEAVQVPGQSLDWKNFKNSSDSSKKPSFLVKRIVQTGVLCNNASIKEKGEDGKDMTGHGDPTETALLIAGIDLGLSRNVLLERFPEAKEVPFDQKRMMMATFHHLSNQQGKDETQDLRVAVKGAPIKVLKICSRTSKENLNHDSSAGYSSLPDSEKDLESNPQSEPMTDKIKKDWQAAIKSMASKGYRVLGLAEKTAKKEDEDPYKNLTFLGLMGLMDPPRRGVSKAVSQCHKAGIRIVMVTGDNAVTAGAIAKNIGLVKKGEETCVIQGQELKDPDEMTEKELKSVSGTSVFARVSPEQKLNLVGLMQDQGLTTAMTGDGVNDTPALKKADIGIAMGRQGTDAARETADMVLQDDSFSSIVLAVRQGRIIFDKIRKSIMFMLCTNIAEIIAVGIAAVLGGFLSLPLPLLPLQILYLNIITDVFPALALGMGKGEKNIMEQDPRPRKESVLTRYHWKWICGFSSLMAACVMVSLAVSYYILDFTRYQAVTVSFLTLAFSKLWFVFNLRNRGSGLFKNDISENPYILGSILLCSFLLILAVYLPGLSSVLKTRPPGITGWALLITMSLVPFLWGQLRIINNRRPK